ARGQNSNRETPPTLTLRPSLPAIDASRVGASLLHRFPPRTGGATPKKRHRPRTLPQVRQKRASNQQAAALPERTMLAPADDLGVVACHGEWTIRVVEKPRSVVERTRACAAAPILRAGAGISPLQRRSAADHYRKCDHSVKRREFITLLGGAEPA